MSWATENTKIPHAIHRGSTGLHVDHSAGHQILNAIHKSFWCLVEEELGSCTHHVPSLSVIFFCYPKQYLSVLLYFPTPLLLREWLLLLLWDYGWKTQSTLENHIVPYVSGEGLGMSLNLISLQSSHCLKTVPWIRQEVKSSTQKKKPSEMDGSA